MPRDLYYLKGGKPQRAFHVGKTTAKQEEVTDADRRSLLAKREEIKRRRRGPDATEAVAIRAKQRANLTDEDLEQLQAQARAIENTGVPKAEIRALINQIQSGAINSLTKGQQEKVRQEARDALQTHSYNVAAGIPTFLISIKDTLGKSKKGQEQLIAEIKKQPRKLDEITRAIQDSTREQQAITAAVTRVAPDVAATMLTRLGTALSSAGTVSTSPSSGVSSTVSTTPGPPAKGPATPTVTPRAPSAPTVPAPPVGQSYTDLLRMGSITAAKTWATTNSKSDRATPAEVAALQEVGAEVAPSLVSGVPLYEDILAAYRGKMGARKKLPFDWFDIVRSAPPATAPAPASPKTRTPGAPKKAAASRKVLGKGLKFKTSPVTKRAHRRKSSDEDGYHMRAVPLESIYKPGHLGSLADLPPSVSLDDEYSAQTAPFAPVNTKAPNSYQLGKRVGKRYYEKYGKAVPRERVKQLHKQVVGIHGAGFGDWFIKGLTAPFAAAAKINPVLGFGVPQASKALGIDTLI